MEEEEPGMVVRRMEMMKMEQGELGNAGKETGEDGAEQVEMRAVILRGILQKPGRTRQIKNQRKMVKKRKMKKGVRVGKAKMRRNRTKRLIRKGRKKRPTRRKRTKRNQDLGNFIYTYIYINIKQLLPYVKPVFIYSCEMPRVGMAPCQS